MLKVSELLGWRSSLPFLVQNPKKEKEKKSPFFIAFIAIYEGI